MADFFSRIAERTLGLAPTVQPKLPPIFAPVPPIETSSETTLAPFTQQDEHFSPHEILRSDLADPGIKAQATQTARREHEALRNDSHAPAVAGSVEGRREPDVRRRENAETQSQDPLSIVSAPARVAEPASQTFLRHHSVAPTVQVTIGRVEVRAVTPPAQTTHAIERKAPPLFSLEEYLRERNGRRR